MSLAGEQVRRGFAAAPRRARRPGAAQGSAGRARRSEPCQPHIAESSPRRDPDREPARFVLPSRGHGRALPRPLARWPPSCSLVPLGGGGRRRRAAAGSAAPARRRAPRGRRAPPSLVVPAGAASARDLAVGEACRRGLGARPGRRWWPWIPTPAASWRSSTPALGVASAYQPCSVFKIVVAIAGLTEGVITPETTYNCTAAAAGSGRATARSTCAARWPTPATPTSSGWASGSATRRCSDTRSCWAWARRPASTSTGEAAGRVPAFVRPSRGGPLSSHAAGIDHLGRPARGAALRRRSTAASSSSRRSAAAGGLRAARALAAAARARCWAGWRTGSWARSTRAARRAPSTPTWWWPARRAPAPAWAGSRPTRPRTGPRW